MSMMYLMADVIPLPCCVMLIAAAFILQLLCCMLVPRRSLKAVPVYLLIFGGICGALRCISCVGAISMIGDGIGVVSGSLLHGLMLLCGVGVCTIGLLAAWLVYLLVRLYSLENIFR